MSSKNTRTSSEQCSKWSEWGLNALLEPVMSVLLPTSQLLDVTVFVFFDILGDISFSVS